MSLRHDVRAAGMPGTSGPHTAPRPTGSHPRVRPVPGHGRLATGLAWLVLLLGLWLWGRDLTGGATDAHLTATGDVAAVGRPLDGPPPAHAPVAAPGTVRPTRLSVEGLGTPRAIVPRPAATHGTPAPPPAATTLTWLATGPQPGEAGAAVLVARTVPGISGIEPGRRLDVHRSDGGIAQFTVEDVKVYPRGTYDRRSAHRAHDPARAELRLIAGATTTDAPPSDVVVSAHLTGFRPR